MLVEGERLHLECRTWGYPLPHVKWRKISRADAGEVDVVAGGRVTLTDFENVVNASLTITDMSTNDYGTYICVADNGVGNDSESILVRVKGINSISAVPISAGSKLSFIESVATASSTINEALKSGNIFRHLMPVRTNFVVDFYCGYLLLHILFGHF